MTSASIGLYGKKEQLKQEQYKINTVKDDADTYYLFSAQIINVITVNFDA